MPDRVEIDAGPLGKTSGLAYLSSGHGGADATLVLAHGAGADQHSRFMTGFATGLASRGVDVLTFNFFYTEQRRRIPDRTDALEACFRAAITAARSYPPLEGNGVFIGGKSMGGRIATQLAAGSGRLAARNSQVPTSNSQLPTGKPTQAEELGGVVALGYPLHPPGKPAQLRIAHLPDIRVPMLIVQGSKDSFGTPAELKPVLDALASPVTLHVVENGDHSLAPPKRTGSVDQVYDDLQNVIARWIRQQSGATPP